MKIVNVILAPLSPIISFLLSQKNKFLCSNSFLIFLLSILPLFSFCTFSSNLDINQRQKYAKKGAMIVSEARGHLNTQLYQFLTKGDVKSALIGACRLSVIAGIDSLAKQKNVGIKRVTKQNRNKGNQPTSWESKELDKYQKLNRDSAVSKVTKNGDKVVFLSPIYVNSTCLKCHGEQGLTLDDQAKELTRYLYPNDQAIGYKDGDFRGLWSVTFFDENE